MAEIPDPAWLVLVLAGMLLLDAVMSIRPPKFIRDCLNGVRFPEEWWWTLIVIKLLATAGLIVGLWVPGVAFSANVGVVAYFLCASAAHFRARFVGKEFWVNCLGFLIVSILVLVFGFFV